MVLADEENSFATSLENLALKKSSNNEVFSCIKKLFDKEIRKPEFKQVNEETFKRKDGSIPNYPQLDTSVEKLRKRYANLKTEWRRISERAKTGSGLSPEKEPKWFFIINEIFAETNAELQLASGAKYVSFSNDIELYEDDRSTSESESTNDDEELETMENTQTKAKVKKVVAAPHKKRKAVRSQQQALSHLAASVEQMANSQMKKHRLSMEADLKRDAMFLEFKKEETEKDREHELRIAQIYGNAMASNHQSQQFQSPPRIPATSTRHNMPSFTTEAHSPPLYEQQSYYSQLMTQDSPNYPHMHFTGYGPNNNKKAGE